MASLTAKKYTHVLKLTKSEYFKRLTTIKSHEY